MKKTLLLIGAVALSTLTLSGCLFQDDSGNTPQTPKNTIGFIDYLTIVDPDLNPYDIRALSDNSLTVSGLGHLEAGTTKQGQLWAVGPLGTTFSRATISSTATQPYEGFFSFSYDQTTNNLYTCSVSSINNIAPTIIRLHRSAPNSYTWSQVTNYPVVANQTCGHMQRVDNELFILQPAPISLTTTALYSVNISGDMPTTATSVATYANLGFTALTMEPFVAAEETYMLSDIRRVFKTEAANPGLFILDDHNNQIVHVTLRFGIPTVGAWSVDPSKTTRLQLPQSITIPLAMVAYSNLQFVISSTDISSMPAKGKIFLVNFDAHGILFMIDHLATLPRAVTAMAMGKDRFGRTPNPVVYAVEAGPHDNAYHVAEVAFKPLNV